MEDASEGTDKQPRTRPNVGDSHTGFQADRTGDRQVMDRHLAALTLQDTHPAFDTQIWVKKTRIDARLDAFWLVGG